MKRVVVDTSALLRLYVPDGPVPAGTEEAINEAWRAETLVIVPELALVEAAQVLHKKVQRQLLSVPEADEILAGILELPVEVIGHRELMRGAVALARAQGLTVYDALFLSLALTEQAALVTADAHLQAAWARARGATS